MKNINFIFELGGPIAFLLILGMQVYDRVATPTPPESISGLELILPDPAKSDVISFPVSGHSVENIISKFGDKRGKTRKHLGVDIKAPRHTKIVAVADGKIERVKESGNGGKTIYLRSEDGILYFYAHLEDWLVEEGTTVKQGQNIATVGDSGNAKGTTPHLHFEIMTGKGRERVSIDPFPILERL